MDLKPLTLKEGVALKERVLRALFTTLYVLTPKEGARALTPKEGASTLLFLTPKEGARAALTPKEGVRALVV